MRVGHVIGLRVYVSAAAGRASFEKSLRPQSMKGGVTAWEASVNFAWPPLTASMRPLDNDAVHAARVIRHAMFEMVMARVCAIACGYEDAVDLDRLRHDPLMKVAVERCPHSGLEPTDRPARR
jgi:Transposase DDE domain group 1